MTVTPIRPGSPDAPRGERNRNPGNLRFSPHIEWLGADDPPQDDGGYCRFVSAGMGIRALGKDLLSKWKRGLRTVPAIIDVYAPPTENNTEAYKADVCARLGISPTAEIDLTDSGQLLAFVRAIIWHECGRIVYDAATLGQSVSLALA